MPDPLISFTDDLKAKHANLVFDVFKHMKLKPYDTENLTQFEKYKLLDWFVVVHNLKEGSTFGELALINDEPRAASVRCHGECYFATLCKSEYEKFLKKLETKEISKKMDFFNKVPFLKHWNSK